MTKDEKSLSFGVLGLSMTLTFAPLPPTIKVACTMNVPFLCNERIFVFGVPKFFDCFCILNFFELKKSTFMKHFYVDL